MRMLRKILGAAAVVGALSSVSAAGLDGSRPLLCALTHSVVCDTEGDCVNGPATAVNLPVFLNVDVGNKVIESTREGGERRSSKILSTQTENGALVVSGTDADINWITVIDQSSGELTGTMAKPGVGYLVFGACLAN